MIDYAQARRTMVDCQIRPNDVTDYRVLEAFMEVPREVFVSSAQKPLAYIDEDLPLSGTAENRYLMEAMSLSRLIQLADVSADDFVLDIGCATGYSTAVLSRLGNSVVGLEVDKALADEATRLLMDLGYSNTAVVTGPLDKGYPKEAPFDVILVSGSVDALPDVLCEQLRDGGRLVVVEGRGNTGEARLYTKTNGVVSSRRAFNASVMPLPGFERESGFVF
ncbi:MAG: protein-L-isoaspartate O-methyltransferase [Pseudomonadota bacterium]